MGGMQALLGLMAWRESHTRFIRERAAGYYSTVAYVLAKVIIDGLVLRLGPPLLMGAIFYPMAGLQGGREPVFLFGLCLVSFSSSAFCMMLGSVAPRSGATLPLAVLLILIFLLFGSPMINDPPSAMK